MAQLSRFQFAMKPFQVLLFSLLLLSSPFLLYLSHYKSTYLMQLICFKSDRKYIFLACNGILVFLIRNSILKDFSPLENSSDYEHVREEKEMDHDQLPAPKLDDESNLEVEAEQGRDSRDLVTVRTQGKGCLSIEEEEEDVDEDDTSFQEEDDTYVIREEEEETSLLSAKELKKKFDDFITKMRLVIDIEVPVKLYIEISV